MDYSLQNKINRRLNQLKRDGVKFISGTIAPADACTEVNSLEPHYTALDYFEQKDENLNISVQIKWMGSRGTMYLFREDVEKSFVTTRNGYKIGYGSDRLEDSKNFFKHWHKKIFTDEAFEIASEVILDGEIMPWNAIGEGLIQRQFVGYSQAVHSEIDFLTEHGIGTELESHFNSPLVTEYSESSEEDKKGNKFRESFELMNQIFKGYSNSEQSDAINAFDSQLDNYNVKMKPFYVAFDILRIKYPDGSIMVNDGWLASTVTKYSFLKNKWPVVAKNMVKPLIKAIIDNSTYMGHDNIGAQDMFDIGLPVSSDDTHSLVEYAMQQVVKCGFEGLMLKPEYPMDTDAVHALKLRNPEYLRLIYGHDYTRSDKYDTLVASKRTAKKRKLSHNEYQLGIEMLKLDENSSSYEEDFERIAKKILFDIEEESTVDSRL